MLRPCHHRNSPPLEWIPGDSLRYRDLFALFRSELRADRVPGGRLYLQEMLEELMRTLTDAPMGSANAAGAATWSA